MSDRLSFQALHVYNQRVLAYDILCRDVPGNSEVVSKEVGMVWASLVNTLVRMGVV